MIDGNTVNDNRLNQLIETCPEFSTSHYENMDNNRLAVFTIGKLLEENLPRTQESISVALFLMFPSKFSLPGFPKFPDTERTNRTLLQLGAKYRNWAIGNRHIGYSLNDSGKIILEQTKELLNNPKLQKVTKKRRTPKPRTREPNQDIKDIEESNLFKLYRMDRTDEVNEHDFWQLMHAFSYTPKRALKNRISDLRNSALSTDRKDIISLLDFMEKKFSDFIKED